MIKSKLGQRLVGLGLFLVGAGFVGWEWYTAFTEGTYSAKASAFFPAFTVLGLGLILFPIDTDKLKAEHGVEQIQSFRQAPPAWKVLIFAAIAAGLANWFAISHF
jgi:hypothetical protein